MCKIKLFLISGQTINAECYDDEYEEINLNWMERSKSVLAFNNACVHANDVIAIEYLKDNGIN